MEKITVKICQRDYSLKTDEKPEKLAMLAAQFEKTIAQVGRKLVGKSEIETVTFAALIMMSDIENIVNGKAETKELEERLAAANIALATANEQLARMSGNGDFDDMAAEIDLLHEELEKNEAKIKQQKDEIQSARDEVNHFAVVKEEENNALRAQIADYERQFQSMDATREKEMEKLRESFDEANSRLEQMSGDKNAENEKLRGTLESYEATFDMYVKTKEDEIKALQEETERLRVENSELEKKLANAGDVQLTMC